MKKSKLLRTTAKETLENVHLGQAAVELEFKYRHDGPFTLKATRRCFTRYVKALRIDRIFLHAVEKQIPMPVRVHKDCVVDKYCGRAQCRILTVETCPVCREWLCYGEMKYCPYCGQKLWWPK